MLLALAVVGLALRAGDKISFAYVAMAFLYGALVWFLWNTSRIVNSWGALTLTHVLARPSFGMYLNHLIDHNEIRRAHAFAAAITGSTVMQAMLSLLIVVGQSVVIATITYLLIEQPWLRLRASVMRTSPSRESHVKA